MPSVEQVLDELRAKARPEDLAGMAQYGMTTQERLGVRVPEMRKIAKQLGKDHQLALDLWQTGIAEARILASMVDRPEEVTEEQMEAWVRDLDSWDVCDQLCMNLLDKTPLAWRKVREWSHREQEYVKRAAYALIACLAWHDKAAPDQAFIDLMPLIVAGATDGRNYVKKAVSWALRHIGKRNPRLHGVALQTAAELSEVEAPSARWIAAQAVRDLNSGATQRRLAKMGGHPQPPTKL
jgi:3-methyladenine DNA glycosylase AlkD